MKISKGYHKRPFTHLPPVVLGDCLTKQYGILYAENAGFMEEEWELAHDFFRRKRQVYPNQEEESDYGYLILHKGMDANYIVTCWWSGENMLRMFSFRSTLEEPMRYAEINDGLNICVWDMLVHSHERDSFVRNILNRKEDQNREAYVRDYYEGEADRVE